MKHTQEETWGLIKPLASSQVKLGDKWATELSSSYSPMDLNPEPFFWNPNFLVCGYTTKPSPLRQGKIFFHIKNTSQRVSSSTRQKNWNRQLWQDLVWIASWNGQQLGFPLYCWVSKTLVFHCIVDWETPCTLCKARYGHICHSNSGTWAKKLPQKTRRASIDYTLEWAKPLCIFSCNVQLAQTYVNTHPRMWALPNPTTWYT